MNGCNGNTTLSTAEAVASSGIYEESDNLTDTHKSDIGSVVTDNNITSYRDNTPVCLVPTADGIAAPHNEVALIDYSHASDGYICAIYNGSVSKIKLRIASPDGTLYTYDLQSGTYETFPLSCGSGNYEVTIYENISGTGICLDYAAVIILCKKCINEKEKV